MIASILQPISAKMYPSHINEYSKESISSALQNFNKLAESRRTLRTKKAFKLLSFSFKAFDVNGLYPNLNRSHGEGGGDLRSSTALKFEQRTADTLVQLDLFCWNNVIKSLHMDRSTNSGSWYCDR